MKAYDAYQFDDENSKAELMERANLGQFNGNFKRFVKKFWVFNVTFTLHRKNSKIYEKISPMVQ